MLFAKRDLKDSLGKSLGQRFTDQLGRFLAVPNEDHIHPTDSIDIPLCYALIDEANTDTPVVLASQKQLFQRIIKSYHHKTGHWISQEQVAFATAWQDTKHQAAQLQERFKHQNIPLSTLQHNPSSTFLQLALLADALQIKQFSYLKPSVNATQTSACNRLLNLSLDDTCMAELEAIGRKVRNNCEKAHLEEGVSLEDMETCWRLKLRYEDDKNSLTLKCMPIEMLREVFETTYLKKYGATEENRVIVIEELEIEVRSTKASPSLSNKQSFYAQQWTSQWHRLDDKQTGLWIKHSNPDIQAQFSWLACPILEEMLVKLTTKLTDSTMSDFFITNHQKDVDEAAMRN